MVWTLEKVRKQITRREQGLQPGFVLVGEDSMFSANGLINADTDDLRQLALALANAEGKIGAKAIGRVTKRAARIGADVVVEEAADDLRTSGLTKRQVRRSVAVAYFNGGSTTNTAAMSSGWFRLADHGMGRKTDDGVQNRLGHYDGAFKATMSNGHRGIFKRIGKSRLPIRELWGLNPMREVERENSDALEMGQEAAMDHLGNTAYQLLEMAL